MNKNAKAWVAALRSGKYEQTQNTLHLSVDGKDRFSALGVACALFEADKNTDSLKAEPDASGIVTYAGHFTASPEAVTQWLRLNTEQGAHQNPELGWTNLNSLNDDQGWTFAQLADLIDSEPDGLFSAEATDDEPHSDEQSIAEQVTSAGSGSSDDQAPKRSRPKK